VANSTSSAEAADRIRALYRALLDREPDVGASEKTDRLAAGLSSLEDIVREIVGSEEYADRFGALRETPAPSEPGTFTNDQTQFGELEILLRLWINGTARQRIVVDVGARGRERSNSFDLMRTFGWRGILFEANPNLIPSINTAFAGLDYELVQCAVSDYSGEAVFHLGVNDDVSSLDPEAAGGWGPISGAIAVEVQRLGTALQKRNVPTDFDLLSIDIEGEDIKVLNDLIDNSAYRPGWVVIEASYDFRTTSLDDLPFSAKVKETYALVGQTVANLILQRVSE
jgi:FkbM family methyltransferase